MNPKCVNLCLYTVYLSHFHVKYLEAEAISKDLVRGRLSVIYIHFIQCKWLARLINDVAPTLLMDACQVFELHRYPTPAHVIRFKIYSFFFKILPMLVSCLCLSLLRS